MTVEKSGPGRWKYTDWNGSTWTITAECPPIPTKAFDYSWVSDDYDGAPDSHDDRHGNAPDVASCVNQIEEYITERTLDSLEEWMNVTQYTEAAENLREYLKRMA